VTLNDAVCDPLPLPVPVTLAVVETDAVIAAVPLLVGVGDAEYVKVNV
jgi:hypothetical protein